MSNANGIGNLQQIFGSTTLAPVKSAGVANTASASDGVSPKLAGTSSDSTNLSVASGLLAQALSGDDVRTDKVAALQQSIAAGTYNVSASDVADTLIHALLK